MTINHNSKLNVMHVVLNLDLAGAQEVVRTLTEYLRSDDCEVTVCAFRDGPMRSEIEKLGVRVEILRHPRYKSMVSMAFLSEMARVRRELLELIGKYHIHIVQTHLLELLDFLALTLRKSTKPPAILWTVHNVNFLPGSRNRWLGWTKKYAYRAAYRLLTGRVDGFIAVSDEVREAILREIGAIDGKIITISNGVDIKRYEVSGDKAAFCSQLNLERSSRLVVTVGRLTRQKGHRFLIDAAAVVVASFPETHFLFIGDGELKHELQGQAFEAGLSAHVHFLGIRDDVPGLLASTDLFVLPSLWEGLSIALLEAMAAGKPIVATGVSGTVQVMVPGRTGLIVPPADSRALSDAIIQLLSAPAEAQVMGVAAKQHVMMNFSAQKQAAEHLALYRRLLASSN